MNEDAKKHVIKLETKVTLGFERPEVQLEKRRAAIKAALLSATASLAATTASLVGQTFNLEGDGGTPPTPPPWGEVIIGPIWEEKNSAFGEILLDSVEVSFWE